jgi:AraC-like DNA-binding protein
MQLDFPLGSPVISAPFDFLGLFPLPLGTAPQILCVSSAPHPARRTNSRARRIPMSSQAPPYRIVLIACRILNRVLTAIYAVGESLTALVRVPDQETLAPWLCDMLEQLIDAIETNTRRPNSVQLARALEFMQKPFADDLARAAGLSPRHYSRLMRAKTNWSFTELLIRLRVDHACHLLAHTELGLVRIALACGFGDQSYFSCVLCRLTNQTPSDYRRVPQALAPKS